MRFASKFRAVAIDYKVLLVRKVNKTTIFATEHDANKILIYGSNYIYFIG
jgi:hypothetical protein